MAKYLLKIICSCLESCFFMSSKLYDSVLKTNRVFSCMKASTLEVLRRHFSNFFGKNCLLKYVGIDISVLFRPDIIYFRNFFFFRSFLEFLRNFAIQKNSYKYEEFCYNMLCWKFKCSYKEKCIILFRNIEV